MVKNNKDYLEESLSALGFDIVPSKANFIFLKHDKVKAGVIYDKLKERNILVRHYTGPIQENYLRITVGSMLEIKALVKALDEILSE